MQAIVDLLAPGAPPSLPLSGRRAVADRYVEEFLVPWLDDRRPPIGLAVSAVADVRLRLHALAHRWTTGERLIPLLGSALEIAQWNEPSELNLLYRAAATVGVRNSLLEDLHVCEPSAIEQEDWRELTVAAAHGLGGWGGMRGADEASMPDDPFAGLDERYPVAWQTFGQMLFRDASGAARFDLPPHSRLEAPEAEVETQYTESGVSVLPAMDSRIDSGIAEVLRGAVADDIDALVVPSLKHISRNPQRLFHVVEVLLTNGSLIKTANLQLEPGLIVWRGGGAVHYNEFDLDWVSDHTLRTTGRNDPCPCGSGKKFKRCHGA